MEPIIFGGIICVFVVLGVIAYRSDKKQWNGGICAKSGKPWKHVDTDSQGGRLYSDGCGNREWISWPVDR